MKCPYCGADSRVLDTRETKGGIHRRRECLSSVPHRFTTNEHVVGDKEMTDADAQRMAQRVANLVRDMVNGGEA